MCYFITLGVPGQSGSVMSSAAPRGFALSEVENKSILAQLPANFRTYTLTSGMCSCGLYAPRSKRREDPSAYLRRKYEKKGWSEARIKRAIEQASQHRAAKNKEPFVGLRPDVARLVAEIARQVRKVAVIVHFYNGDIEEEPITLSRPRTVHGDALLATSFPFDVDELLWVCEAKRGSQPWIAC